MSIQLDVHITMIYNIVVIYHHRDSYYYNNTGKNNYIIQVKIKL